MNDESSPTSASTEGEADFTLLQPDLEKSAVIVTVIPGMAKSVSTGLSKNDCLVAKHSALMQRSNELEGKIQLYVSVCPYLVL